MLEIYLVRARRNQWKIDDNARQRNSVARVGALSTVEGSFKRTLRRKASTVIRAECARRRYTPPPRRFPFNRTPPLPYLGRTLQGTGSDGAARVSAAASSPIATRSILFAPVPTARNISAWNLNKAKSLAKRPQHSLLSLLSSP